MQQPDVKPAFVGLSMTVDTENKVILGRITGIFGLQGWVNEGKYHWLQKLVVKAGWKLAPMASYRRPASG